MASSNSTVNSPKYDVFVSFRGADTRNNFTSHLYNALRSAGVNAFMDKELKRGEEISSTLFLIIEGSQVSVVIFSPNYAASKFCLDELVKILECKASRQQVVLPVFYNVDPFEVEKQTGEYGKAISSHEAEFKGFKEKMEKLKRWKSAIAEAAGLAGWDLRNRDEAEIIRDIVQHVLQKLNRGQLESSPFEGGRVLDALPLSKEVFPENRLLGENFEINKGDIWDWLTAVDVSSIGIWGMGGVGKTTLLIHIYNKLIEKQEVFGQVHWITVSQDFNVYKLQNLIAKVIGLELGTEEDLLKRAARLLKELSSKGKFVLILDDVWSHFEMSKVGILTENNQCKLIITTRSQMACLRMGLQKLKKIEPLSGEEAWDLFMVTLGHDLTKKVEPIAKNVAKECGGLPLGIVTMAGSMRGVDDIHEWNNALTELRRSEVRPDDMEVEVFSILQFSYGRLNEWVLQQCFLYCALFPEDHKIDREKLIGFLIAEGIIKRQMSRQMDFDKGHAMLNKLVKVSLLEDLELEGGERCIKMHDLIRDMAIQIMKESCQSIVEAGRQLKHVPEEKYWTQGIVWVSLMKNDIAEIRSNYSPKCSTLSTLLLSKNRKLKSIPDSFFLHFRALKVLDLSGSLIEMLPESVGCLGNLKALSLRKCRVLRDMPSLGKLTSLEMLDLSYCWDLKQVPEGLELLSKLTFLNLLQNGIKKLQSGMLTGLSHLQLLAFLREFSWHTDAFLEVEDEQLAKLKKLKSLCGHADAFLEVDAKELAKLEKLESLIWRFHDFREFDEYVRLVSTMQRGWQIINYFLYVGGRSHIDVLVDRPSGRKLYLNDCGIGRELFIPKDLEMLKMKHVTICNGSGLYLKTDSFEPELMSLQIEKCEGMEYLFHLSSSPSILGILKKLKVESLPKLHALFGVEIEEPLSTIPLVPWASMFCSLTEIVISQCNNMKRLCSPRLFSNFHYLEKIRVVWCSEMEEIVATEDERSYGYNLSKLRSFQLEKLPKLKRIYSEQIICDSLKKFGIIDCGELEKIPISLPLHSLNQLRIWPEEWWESVQWGSPDQKSALRPQFIQTSKCW